MNRQKIFVTSTMDETEQPSYLILPSAFDPDGPRIPLVVSLHTWSDGLEQRNEFLEQAVLSRGWLYLFPHFRGRNDHPEALGSELAQQDILDATQWVCSHYPVDPGRIYLTGVSGGGHMTLLMAGRHPDLWAAASAWVGISDLAAWHASHIEDSYGEMMRQSLGGAPGTSPEIDAEYRERSPLTHLAGARTIAIDIAAGRHDGYTGSVPIRHSLEAFNAVAAAMGAPAVSEAEITQLSRIDGSLDKPRPSDTATDASFGRALFLRRFAGRSRVTIFEGGHEGLAEAAVAWFERHAQNSRHSSA